MTDRVHLAASGRRAGRFGLGLLTLVLTGALVSGAALAAASYTVHLKVPGTVQKGKRFTVKATGKSANRSRLTVFVDTKACAGTAAAEGTHPKSSKIITHNVVGDYTETGTVAANGVGRHHACAYLNAPPSSPTRASVSASYTVVSNTVSTTTTTTTTTTTPTTSDVNACTLLTLAQVTELLGNGESAAPGQPLALQGIDDSCGWLGGGASVTLDYNGAAYTYDNYTGESGQTCAGVVSGEGNPQIVSGVAWHGYYCAEGTGNGDGIAAEVGNGTTLVVLDWSDGGIASLTPPDESDLSSDVTQIFQGLGA
jgi:hypothetical protein